MVGAGIILLGLLYGEISYAGTYNPGSVVSGTCTSQTTATCYAHDGVTPVTAPADIATYCLNNGALYVPANAEKAANGDPRGQECDYSCTVTIPEPPDDSCDTEMSGDAFMEYISKNPAAGAPCRVLWELPLTENPGDGARDNNYSDRQRYLDSLNLDRLWGQSP